jgi:hypothetical protein
VPDYRMLGLRANALGAIADTDGGGAGSITNERM